MVGLTSGPLSALLSSTAPPQGRLRYQGQVAMESMLFESDGKSATNDHQWALFTRLETHYQRGAWRLKIRTFARADTLETNHSVWGVEEAWISYGQGPWELRLGAQMLDWTATEAFHPADIINSRNLASNLERPEKLGELMLSLSRRLPGGRVTAYWLPRYESPLNAPQNSRLSFVPPQVRIDEAIWIERHGRVSSNNWGNQWGLRFTRNLGSADLSLHVLRHQDRQQPVLHSDSQGRIRPIYLPVTETGGTLLQVLGAWVFKVEYNHKNFRNPDYPVVLGDGSSATVHRPDHSQLALGLEWGWTYKNGADATVLWESQSLFGVHKAQRVELSPFQRDMMIGYRHSWNGIKGRVLLANLIIDLDGRREFLFNLRYEQRLTDTWSVDTGLRRIDAPITGPQALGLERLQGDSQVFFNIRRHF